MASQIALYSMSKKLWTQSSSICSLRPKCSDQMLECILYSSPSPPEHLSKCFRTGEGRRAQVSMSMHEHATQRQCVLAEIIFTAFHELLLSFLLCRFPWWEIGQHHHNVKRLLTIQLKIKLSGVLTNRPKGSLKTSI